MSAVPGRQSPPARCVCAKVPVRNWEGLSLLPVLFLPSQSCLGLQETDTLDKTGRHRLRVSGCWKSQRLPNPERSGASPFWSANSDTDCHLLRLTAPLDHVPALCTLHTTSSSVHSLVSPFYSSEKSGCWPKVTVDRRNWLNLSPLFTNHCFNLPHCQERTPTACVPGLSLFPCIHCKDPTVHHLNVEVILSFPLSSQQAFRVELQLSLAKC